MYETLNLKKKVTNDSVLHQIQLKLCTTKSVRKLSIGLPCKKKSNYMLENEEKLNCTICKKKEKLCKHQQGLQNTCYLFIFLTALKYIICVSHKLSVIVIKQGHNKITYSIANHVNYWKVLWQKAQLLQLLQLLQILSEKLDLFIKPVL